MPYINGGKTRAHRSSKFQGAYRGSIVNLVSGRQITIPPKITDFDCKHPERNLLPSGAELSALLKLDKLGSSKAIELSVSMFALTSNDTEHDFYKLSKVNI